jgi:deoxyadenosine/deoxycytidine kinase
MIYILGSIGAGKTSLTKILAKDLAAPAYYEQIENNGLISQMLKKFYAAGEKSRKTTGAILQIAFLTYRYQQLKQAIKQKNAVMDSSLESDFVMATQLHQNGEIDDIDYQIYVTLSQEMQSNVNGSPWNAFPDLAIYLKISPEHELKKIQQRGRTMEDSQQNPELKKYYFRVNQAYQNWAKGYSHSILLTIDRDRLDFVNNLKDRNLVLNQIERKLVDLGKLAPQKFQAIQAARELTV